MFDGMSSQYSGFRRGSLKTRGADVGLHSHIFKEVARAAQDSVYCPGSGVMSLGMRVQ